MDEKGEARHFNGKSSQIKIGGEIFDAHSKIFNVLVCLSLGMMCINKCWLNRNEELELVFDFVVY